MDTAQTIDCVEWCFGYGGNHLGLKRVLPRLRCVAACEIEAYAIANLVAKIEAGFLDPFPIWSDVKTFPCEQFRDLVDIFVASYPCQPFSSSGKRKGADDPRHLWPFVRRAVEVIRPRFCFFENVEGHVSLGLREVLTELALLGYRVENSRGEPTWGIFSAAEEGAPQNRKRVFILGTREGVVQDDALREQVERFNAGGFSSGTVRTGRMDDTKGERTGPVSTRSWNEGIGTAESNGAGEIVGQANDSDQRRGKGRSKLKGRQRQSASGESGDSGGVGLADAKCARREGSEWTSAHGKGPSAHGSIAECRPLFWPGFIARPGEQQHGWEPPRTIETERGLGGGVNGRASNVDRLRLLGNGVYPATAAKAFATLMKRFYE